MQLYRMDNFTSQSVRHFVSNLNKAVKRNIKRFPPDFMFQLNKEEWNSLRLQIGILDVGRGQYTKFLPHAFTEQGLAMLSGVLNSDIAINVNISISTRGQER